MKKFYGKLFLFGIVWLSIICAFLWLSAQEKWSMLIAEFTGSEDFVYEDFGANEIMPYVERAQAESGHTKLVIGDSVCNQLFERCYDKNDVYCICGSNQAISLAGQYILAEEFVKSHKEVTDIYLVITMGSLGTDFGMQLGYQYAVMPFVLTDTIDDLDWETRQEIYGKYGRFFCVKPVVELIHNSALNKKLYLNLLAKKDELFPTRESGVISEVSLRYLNKLSALCEEDGINLHILPGPHADSEERHKLENEIRKAVQDNEKLRILQDYPDQIIYYPKELFRDGIHFDEQKLEDGFLEDVVKEILPEVHCTTDNE